MIYDVDYFIKKFTAIPDKEIGKVKIDNHCTLWHCGVRDYEGLTEEAMALGNLLMTLEPDANSQEEAIVHLNDSPWMGKVVGPGKTPKERIMRALRKIKKAQVKERIVYVTVDKVVRELQKTELHEQ